MKTRYRGNNYSASSSISYLHTPSPRRIVSPSLLISLHTDYTIPPTHSILQFWCAERNLVVGPLLAYREKDDVRPDWESYAKSDGPSSGLPSNLVRGSIFKQVKFIAYREGGGGRTCQQQQQQQQHAFVLLTKVLINPGARCLVLSAKDSKYVDADRTLRARHHRIAVTDHRSFNFTHKQSSFPGQLAIDQRTHHFYDH